MKRTARIVASTLAIGALGIAGSQSAASANNVTNTCTHGVAANNSGHAWVAYLGYSSVGGAHVHKYRHYPGIFFVPQHDAFRPC